MEYGHVWILEHVSNRHVSETSLTKCSNMQTFLDVIVNIIRELGRGGVWPIWSFISKIIFTLMMNMTFIQAPKLMKKVATWMIVICLSSWTNHVSHILRGVGAYDKNAHLRLINLKICGRYSITLYYWTLEFDWCVIRWGLENKHQKDKCSK